MSTRLNPYENLHKLLGDIPKSHEILIFLAANLATRRSVHPLLWEISVGRNLQLFVVLPAVAGWGGEPFKTPLTTKLQLFSCEK